MINILHAADFHLDSPFAGLSPQQATQRRAAQRTLLERLATLAKERRADLVLLCGDLLDDRHIFRETAQALSRCLGEIPCPVFISPGNHDFYSPSSIYATLDWPENVHIFKSRQLESVYLPALSCRVWGRAFLSAHESQAPLEGFSCPEEAGVLQLACLHGEVATASDYAPISTQHMAQSGFAYVALGHIHQCSGLQQAKDTSWAYPGCPEGRGFDELGEKGCLFLTLAAGQTSCEFIPLSKHRYAIVSVDMTQQESPLQAVLDKLPQDTQGDIYRILLTGTCQAPNVTALQRELAERFYAVTVSERTRLPQNLWARREEDTLTGLFLQGMYEQAQLHSEDPLYQLAARFGLAALEDGEDFAL